MRIGLMAGAGNERDKTLAGRIALAQRAENDGFHSFWLAHIFDLDAITTLALIGAQTRRIELGTAVVPSYPRHPAALAQQVLSAAVASGGRFTLGLGLSHKIVIEDMLGLDYSKPLRHMREYLAVLLPLLAGEPVDWRGEEYRVQLGLSLKDTVPAPSVLLAALGPQMLKLAGEQAAGTTTWMTGFKTLEEHIVPRLRAAATDAARGQPRVVAGVPVILTRDAGAVKAKLSESMQMYAEIPSYRAMLEREGASGPADVALVGDEAQLRADLRRLREIGVTDLNAVAMEAEPGAFERTWEFLRGEL